MSWVAAMRGPGSGGASTINGCRPKLGPNAGRKARKFGSARAALLPIRSGLLAHREGRKLDRHPGNLGRDQLAAMTYRQREAFKARYRFREHTLENWDDMSWQTSAKLIRALKAEREERERKEQLKP
jgi:hypothetical protein